MKKILVLAILAISCPKVMGQDYIPLLQEGNSWNAVQWAQICNPWCVDHYSNQPQAVLGEEIIDDITYTVVEYDNFLSFYMREENGVLYAYNSESPEEDIVLDFTLDVGDVFTIPLDTPYSGTDAFSYFTVLNTYTEFIADSNRKVIELGVDDTGYHIETWVEGIGNLNAGIFPGGEYLEASTDLSCFNHQGNTYYFNGYTQCTVLGVADFSINNAVLYPNPISDTATLQFSQSGIVDLVRIFDVSGRLVKEIPVETDRVIFHKSDYSVGMYFYRVYSNKLPLGTQSFVVE